jgi:hypothetical protein
MTYLVKTDQGLELTTTDCADAFELARRYAMQWKTTVTVTRMLADESGELVPLGEPVPVVGQADEGETL